MLVALRTKAHLEAPTRRGFSLRSGSSDAAFVDANGRGIRYLRVSVTDRCNFRCTYCRTDRSERFGTKEEVLSYDEIARVVAVFARRGLERVRLTGGEPLLRRELPRLVAALRAIETPRGPLEVVLTTNGHLLGEQAAALARAGLAAVTVSLDSLRPDRFHAVTRGGDLGQVLAGIDAAQRAGLRPIKLNVVALRGRNDDELGDLAAFAFERGLVPRFIELMPMADGEPFVPAELLCADEIRERLAAAFSATLVPEVPPAASGIAGLGPARYFTLRGGLRDGARVGVIAAMTENFCGSCNRVRLSATGQLHGCLGYDDAHDLRAPARRGDDDAIEAVVRRALASKRDGHGFQTSGCGGPHKSMLSIGG